MRVLMEDIMGRREQPLPDLPIEAYPNPLEKAILNKAADKSWFRTDSGNEAFTLSYGELTHETVDEDDYWPKNSMPCCWSDDCEKLVADFPLKVEGKTSRVVFVGQHFATIHSGRFSEASHHFTFGDNGAENPTIEEQYGERLQTIIDSDETTYLRKRVWKAYCDEKDIVDCIRPETYSAILRPALFAQLTSQFGLSGGEWYLLPSDCHSCT